MRFPTFSPHASTILRPFHGLFYGIIGLLIAHIMDLAFLLRRFGLAYIVFSSTYPGCDYGMVVA